MTTAQDTRIFGTLVPVVALLVLALTACDSPSDQSAAAPGDVAQSPAPAGSRVRQASIDANGNIAPFGFASRKPVPVPELQTAAVVTAATPAVFSANCVACHGPEARGVEGLGLNLVESPLVAKSSAADLVVFLKDGRAVDSPDNVTGVPMPSFVWMSETDLTEVAAYLKSLNKG